MNHYKVKHPRKNLEAEIAFTKAYRKAKKKRYMNTIPVRKEIL